MFGSYIIIVNIIIAKPSKYFNPQRGFSIPSYGLKFFIRFAIIGKIGIMTAEKRECT